MRCRPSGRRRQAVPRRGGAAAGRRSIGIDERPLDASRAEDARWLHACIWPGETNRLERLQAAITAFREARQRGERLEIQRRHAVGTPAWCARRRPRPREHADHRLPDDDVGLPRRGDARLVRRRLHELVDVVGLGLPALGRPRSHGITDVAAPAELWVHTRSGDRRASFLIGTMGYHPRRSAYGTTPFAIGGAAALVAVTWLVRSTTSPSARRITPTSATATARLSATTGVGAIHMS